LRESFPMPSSTGHGSEEDEMELRYPLVPLINSLIPGTVGIAILGRWESS